MTAGERQDLRVLSAFQNSNDSGLTDGAADVDVQNDIRSAEIASVVMPVFFILIGITGNIITVIALCHCQKLCAGARLYLSTLCVLDVWTMAVSVLRFWLLAAWDWDLRCATTVACKLVPWLEMTPLVACPFLLALLLSQVVWGLAKSHAPGANITRCGAFLAITVAVLLSMAINSSWIFLLTTSTQQQQQHSQNSSSSSVTPAPHNSTIAPSCATAGRSKCCGAKSGDDDMEELVHRALPWLSATASLTLPLLKVLVGLGLMAYFLCFLRCRRDGCRPPHEGDSDEEEEAGVTAAYNGQCCVSGRRKFRTLTTCVLWLSVIFVLTTLPLTCLVLSDPDKYWTAYETNFHHQDSHVGNSGSVGETGASSTDCAPGFNNSTDVSVARQLMSNSDDYTTTKDDHFVMFVSLRLVYFLQFASRWIVVCSLCGLWPIVARMFRKGSCREKHSNQTELEEAVNGATASSTHSHTTQRRRTRRDNSTSSRNVSSVVSNEGNSVSRLVGSGMSQTSMSAASTRGRTSFYPVSSMPSTCSTMTTLPRGLSATDLQRSLSRPDDDSPNNQNSVSRASHHGGVVLSVPEGSQNVLFFLPSTSGLEPTAPPSTDV